MIPISKYENHVLNKSYSVHFVSIVKFVFLSVGLISFLFKHSSLFQMEDSCYNTTVILFPKEFIPPYLNLMQKISQYNLVQKYTVQSQVEYN